MTFCSSPYPNENSALRQVHKGKEVGKLQESGDRQDPTMPSSRNSVASNGSEDAGFEDGPVDVDMDVGDDENLGIQCIQTMTVMDSDRNPGALEDSPPMVHGQSQVAIPLPPPPHIGSGAFGGNQSYGRLASPLTGPLNRPPSPMNFWDNTAESSSASTRRPGDVGLQNLGNTCFMNAGLQCMVHTSALVEFFLKDLPLEKNTLTYQFYSVMNHVWFGNEGAISPSGFKSALGNICEQFKDCRQHDCQEFLVSLLDNLHEELKARSKNDTQKETVSTTSQSDSYIEDCTTTDELQEVSSTSEADTSSPTMTNGVPKALKESPAIKRLKMGNNEAYDTSREAKFSQQTLSEAVTEVKRKSKSGFVVKNESTVPDESVGGSGDCLTSEATVSSDEQKTESCLSTSEQGQLCWDNYMKANDTVIASTFQGMLKSAVTCSECGFVSETFEPFMYLSLPIPRATEKKFQVTFISMKKERQPESVEVVMSSMCTVGSMIREVVSKISNQSVNVPTCIAAEVYNHRVSRVLDEKIQLSHVSTISRNVYIYELNENFGSNSVDRESTDIPPILLKEQMAFQLTNGTPTKEYLGICYDLGSNEDPVTSRSCMEETITPKSSRKAYGAPVGGSASAIPSSSGSQNVSNDEDEHNTQPINETFNKTSCAICLEDYIRPELKQHRGCSCILCNHCVEKSVEHHVSDKKVPSTALMMKCPVCSQEVDSVIAFVPLDDVASLTLAEDIQIPVIFRNEPGTDDNNNSSWNLGLFGHPWLIRVPAVVNAAELKAYISSINPVPDASYRLLSVKPDGKSCGQCIFTSRCNGCEIPKDGVISLNSSNSILISYVDLPVSQIEHLQPPNMVLHKDSTTSGLQNEEPVIDIHDCLRTFSETEHLDEHNPWYCPRCKKNQQATKALSVFKFPDYLIVYLKRFVFLDQSSNKLNNRLTFPINDLDVSDYVTEGLGLDVSKYNLYSCVCHYGTMTAGHYTAYAKNPVSDLWHYFNDSSVEQSTPGEREYASAYVLFYEKQGLVHNIPAKRDGPLPELNSFNAPSLKDTRGSYLPSEPTVSSDPNGMNLQVDSTSPSFTYPHGPSESVLPKMQSAEGDEVVETEVTSLPTEGDTFTVSSTCEVTMQTAEVHKVVKTDEH